MPTLDKCVCRESLNYLECNTVKTIGRFICAIYGKCIVDKNCIHRTLIQAVGQIRSTASTYRVLYNDKQYSPIIVLCHVCITTQKHTHTHSVIQIFNCMHGLLHGTCNLRCDLLYCMARSQDSDIPQRCILCRNLSRKLLQRPRNWRV